ncbi:class I fructose-bisphosphate aldolase [Candidatus Pelagibacter sp. RS40]|uniref:class I fructose-bisphosphate aldolase n=1 Tax=Candidatus Pelagibacter sp. RS40 TaxID=1977865 RepID=UPI000A15D886|nr:class I fructose-bisphosphate aldolase [Candidatus Pelagibacter sp. RS40]ARJ49271.1 fructose-bisphosphate aldolase [Candidatus Pelagibacter sp. RS40]
MSELYKIAEKILQNGKGILAADESTGTMKKRLDSVNVESNEKNRLIFRETLFSSNSMKECIGGVILYDETIRQKTSQNKSISELISESGAVPGIKVDTGAKMLAGSKEEKITEGLDGLRERLKDYYQLGARFTKWRGVYVISETYPSKLSISANAHALARYAALAQEAGMVPIVEPEVLMDGKHSAKDCYNKTSEVIKRCYDELDINKVDLKGTILKPNMILPGTNSNEKISNIEVAEMTLECLKNNVPSEVPGIAFLSGGQTEVEATNNLNQINVKNDSSFIMTYSYGRALQQSALKFWSKDINNIKGTQEVFDHRAKMCTLAAQGKWSEGLENSK